MVLQILRKLVLQYMSSVTHKIIHSILSVFYQYPKILWVKFNIDFQVTSHDYFSLSNFAPLGNSQKKTEKNSMLSVNNLRSKGINSFFSLQTPGILGQVTKDN